MTFISYAQNFEDVMLWRALRHIEQGFYVDIGAAWPEEESVTKSFYDRGWQGINIEPNPRLHALLEAARDRDTNLNVAVGYSGGIQTLYLISNEGLSTIDESVANEHCSIGFEASTIEVEVVELSDIYTSYIPANQPVHFLKIDVEGLEASIIRSTNWNKFRPWVIVVEATHPMTTTECHSAWEETLVSAGYIFGYTDGLNRFYISEEHEELLTSFTYPPNVFDGFISAATHRAQNAANTSQDKAYAAEEKAIAAKERAISAETFANIAILSRERAEAQLLAIQQSASWRITYPLRLLADILIIRPFNAGRRAANGLLAGLINAFETPLAGLMKFCLRYPRVTALADKRLSRLPFLRSHLMQVLVKSDAHNGSAEITTSSEELSHAHLSPRARQIHADLKAAIKSNR